jgi:hypothetical protein
MYGVGKVLLELVGRGVVASSNAVIDGSMINRVLLELAGMNGKEVSGGKWLGKIWYKEGSLREIKRKCGLHTVHHVEGGIASRLVNSGTVSPEGEGGNRGPVRVVTIACLEDQFAYHTVLPLDSTVCHRVVR